MRGFVKRVTWIGLLVAIVSAVSAASAMADSVKPYSAVLTADVGTGSAAVTAVITNQNPQQQLGSANLTPPAGGGYTLSNPQITQINQGSSAATATVVNNVLQLRNLNLATGTPGGSVTVTVNVGTPACGTGTWKSEAKQANDFSGPPGNDLGPLVNSNLNTTFCTAPCPRNATCTTNSTLGPGSANVFSPKQKPSGQLLQSADASTQVSDPCTGTGYSSQNPNTYGVFTNVDRSKIVSLAFHVPNPLTLPAAQLLQTQNICFDAPYQFPTAGGGTAQPDGNGGFNGLLPDCPSGTFSFPCHDRASDTAVADNPQNTSYTVTLVADIPTGLPGDPHMR